ncbi:MAG: dephospho-CoA kinase [Planctomycetota bacterium]|nr:dephospho-CoA kinase [Planctomycetota bacterium]
MIGLVGGVASGKSMVARLLAEERPAFRIDADAITHEVLDRPGVARRIAARFPGTRRRGGGIDRRKLAARVFGGRSRRALDDLEAIMHPPIRETLKRAIARSRSPLVLVEAALLQENGADGLCDAVVYVAAPARVRRARALSRHGWTEREHRAREAGQWPLRRKRARADIVVDNGGPVERTRRSVRAALRRIDRLRKG